MERLQIGSTGIQGPGREIEHNKLSRAFHVSDDDASERDSLLHSILANRSLEKIGVPCDRLESVHVTRRSDERTHQDREEADVRTDVQNGLSRLDCSADESNFALLVATSGDVESNGDVRQIDEKAERVVQLSDDNSTFGRVREVSDILVSKLL